MVEAVDDFEDVGWQGHEGKWSLEGGRTVGKAGFWGDVGGERPGEK